MKRIDKIIADFLAQPNACAAGFGEQSGWRWVVLPENDERVTPGMTTLFRELWEEVRRRDADARQEAVRHFIAEPEARAVFDRSGPTGCRIGSFHFPKWDYPELWKEARERHVRNFHAGLRRFLDDPEDAGSVVVSSCHGQSPHKMDPSEIRLVEVDVKGFQGSCEPEGQAELALAAAVETNTRRQGRLDASVASFLSDPVARVSGFQFNSLTLSDGTKLQPPGREIWNEAVRRELADAQPFIDLFLADPKALPPGSDRTWDYEELFLEGMRLPLPLDLVPQVAGILTRPICGWALHGAWLPTRQQSAF